MKWPRIRSRRTTTVSPWMSIIAREVEFARGEAPQVYHAVAQADYIAIVALTAVQNQLSLEYPFPLGKGEVELCERHGIAFLPWSPLGGISKAPEAAEAHDPVREAADAHGLAVPGSP